MRDVFDPEARNRVTIAHLLTLCIIAIIVALVLPGSEPRRDDVGTLGRFVTKAHEDAAKLEAAIRADEMDLDRLTASLAALRERIAETERRHPDGMSGPEQRAYLRLVEEHNADVTAFNRRLDGLDAKVADAGERITEHNARLEEVNRLGARHDAHWDLLTPPAVAPRSRATPLVPRTHLAARAPAAAPDAR
jgi:hypothetical protein